jgi:3-oxoacyl-[acyl-carrier protein] reductase
LLTKIAADAKNQLMGNIKYSYNGKNVLVTGGAQGIGFEITRQFLSSGANVTIWDYSEESLENAKKELSDFSSQLSTAVVDVTNRDSVAKATEGLGELEVLVNNAGITRDKSFGKMGDDDWDAVIQTNLTGLYNVTKGLMPKFSADSTNKRIINMASVVALYGNFGQTNYVASKAGVIGMTKTWAKELGRKGFTINAIAPGFILTAMTKKMPPEVLDGMKSKVPVARLGEVQDIANACLFLASEEASYINGHTLSVDGAVVF